MYNNILERGDVLYINFSPQAGREQKGWRPAMVISLLAYNQLLNTVLLCPITSNLAPWAFKYTLSDDEVISGAILVDQCTSRDYRARGGRYHGTLQPSSIEGVLAILRTLTS